MNSQPHEDTLVVQRLCFTLYKLSLYEPNDELVLFKYEVDAVLSSMSRTHGWYHVPVR